MSDPADPFDELAALFLTGPDAAPAAGAGVQAASIVELLVVGHLPVRADLWLTPYADAVARGEGPAAVVRLDADPPTIQVVRGAEGTDVPAAVDDAIPIGVREVANHLAASVTRWIVRPPASAGPLELLEAGADRITVLTSVDELARVRAFERLKTLAETARRHGIAPPPIGLAVIGADRATAQEVAERIRQVALTAGLGIDPQLVACVERIDAAVRAGDRVDLGTAGVDSLRSVVEDVRGGAAVTAPPAAAPASAAAPAARPSPAPAGRLAHDRDPVAPRAAPHTAPSARLPPKPAVELEAKHPARAREPDQSGAPVALADFVEGLAALPVRCPGQERLELGVDAGGRLHVIAREPDMRGLHRVRAWAKSHRELLAMACRDHWIDPRAEPVCHVFSDQPSRLADLHESGLRLHVLAPVVVDGRQGWYHAPLNADVR